MTMFSSPRGLLSRFRARPRAFYSFLLLGTAFLSSLGAELWCNNKPYVLKYQGEYYFPLFRHYPASTFGDEIRAMPDYKAVVASETFKKSQGWALFPLIPYGENEAIADLPSPPPTSPTSQNWLGTDDRGRDLITRLIYGFRNSILFSLGAWVMISLIATVYGCVQGLYGGRVDFLAQRFTEVWSALPVLYVIVFLVSLFPPSLGLLMVVWVAFSWVPLSTYVRAEVLRVRSLDYIIAAKAIGVSTPRLLLRHVIPNVITPLVTLSPFVIAAAVGSLAALDYLGLGVPPPSASWGELLKQGKENITSWWLVFFPFFSLFATLLLLNFIGEGVRGSLNTKELN